MNDSLPPSLSSTSTSSSTPYVFRDSDYEIVHEHQSACRHGVSMPGITWEQFILLNVELDRLSSLTRHLSALNDSLKAQLAKQEELVAENDRLRLQMAKTEFEAQQVMEEAKKVSELETRIAALLKENQGFAAVLNQKMQEIDAWKSKYEEMDQAASMHSNLHKTRVLENEELRAELLRLEMELKAMEAKKSQSEELALQVKALNQNKVELKQELERKEKENEERLEAISELKKKLESSAEEKLVVEKKYEESQTIVEELKIKIKEIEELASTVNMEKKEILVIVEEKTEALEQLKSAQEEIEQMKEMLQTTDQEKEKLKKALAKKSNEFEKSKAEIKQLLQLGAHRTKEIEKYKAQIESLKESDKEMRKLIEKHQSIVDQKDQEIEDLKINLEYWIERNKNKCCGDASKAKHERIHQEKEMKEFKVKMKRLGDAEKKLQNLLSENKRLTAENDRLTTSIIDKRKEMGQVARGRRNKALTMSPKSMSPKMSMANLGVERPSFTELAIRRIKDEYEEPRNSAPLQNNESVNSTSTSVQTKDLLTQVISEKDREIVELKTKLSHLETQVKEAGEETTKVLTEKDRLNSTVTEIFDEIRNLKGETSQNGVIKLKLHAITEERDKLAALVEEQAKEIEMLRAELEEAEEFEAEFAEVMREKQHMSDVLAEKLKEVDQTIIRGREMEVELGRAVEKVKIILAASENEKLSEVLLKKIKEFENVKEKFLTLERACSSMKDTDPSDTVESRRMLNNFLSDDIPLKSKNLFDERKKSSMDKAENQLEYSLDNMTMSPEASPLFDSKLF